MTRVDASRPPAPKPKRGSDAASRNASIGKRGDASPLVPSGPMSSQQRAGGLGSAPVDQAVIDRVREIEAHDPQKRKKAFRCFLAHSMRKELVAAHMEVAAFDSLVENTIAQMEADTDLRHEMTQAIDLLLALAAPDGRHPATR